MTAKYKEYGGGNAQGLGNDWVNFLSQGLNTGKFGAGNPAGGDAVNSTLGIAGVLNDILSGGAGKAGGALSQLIKQDTNDQVLGMRARYGASGGTAFGTGAQYGEGVLRSKQEPQIASAIGGLQLQAVQGLLQLISGTAGKGITQRQGVMEENPWVTGASIAAPLIASGLSAAAGAPGVSKAPQLPNLPQINVPASAYPSFAPNFPGDHMPNMGTFAPSVGGGWTPTLFDYGLR